MKFKISHLVAVAALLISASVFANKVASTDDVDNVYTEDKLNVVLQAGETDFVIKLKSNPTTGYSWFLRDYNANLITPSKHRFVAPTSSQMMGAPGYELWYFHVKPAAFVVPQQIPIRLIYARPWQGAENVTQVVFRVTTVGNG